MSIIERAEAALEGVTPGPWVYDDHEETDYDIVTVGAGTYLEEPGCYTTTDLIHEFDTCSFEVDGPDMAQVRADARFIAESRTLVPALVDALKGWIRVAEDRLQLVETIKAEKRQLEHELNRLGRGPL